METKKPLFRVSAAEFVRYLEKLREKTALFKLAAQRVTDPDVEAELLRAYLDQIAPDLGLSRFESEARAAVYTRLATRNIPTDKLRGFDLYVDGGIVLDLAA